MVRGGERGQGGMINGKEKERRIERENMGENRSGKTEERRRI